MYVSTRIPNAPLTPPIGRRRYARNPASPAVAPYGKGPLDGTPASITPSMEVVRYASAAYGYDGVGEMILPGPEGALSTLHFENYRDGLEDHGYHRHPDSITFLCRLQTATNTHTHTFFYESLAPENHNNLAGMSRIHHELLIDSFIRICNLCL